MRWKSRRGKNIQKWVDKEGGIGPEVDKKATLVKFDWEHGCGAVPARVARAEVLPTAVRYRAHCRRWTRSDSPSRFETDLRSPRLLLISTCSFTFYLMVQPRASARDTLAQLKSLRRATSSAQRLRLPHQQPSLQAFGHLHLATRAPRQPPRPAALRARGAFAWRALEAAAAGTAAAAACGSQSCRLPELLSALAWTSQPIPAGCEWV